MPTRTIDNEMHCMWSMVGLLANDADYNYTPPTPEELCNLSYGLIDIHDEDDGRVPSGTAEPVRERALTDGPPTPTMTASAERYTTALKGEWKRDRGLVVCWTCREHKIVLAPRAARVEAICLNGCDPFMTEAAVDARLEAASVYDFRDYNWKRR